MSKITLEDAMKLAEGRGGQCLETEYVNNRTPMWWRCKKGHLWQNNYGNIKNRKQWCPYCVGVVKKTLEDAQKLAKQKGGECLSTRYMGCMTKMIWRCGDCNHIWEATYHKINGGRWCPACKTKTQKKLAEILKGLLKSDYIYNYRPDWLKNPKTNRALEIDIYFPELGLAVEYNGEQHYKTINFSGSSDLSKLEEALLERKRLDGMKKRMAKGRPEVNNFIIFSYRNIIKKKNIKEILVKAGIL